MNYEKLRQSEEITLDCAKRVEVCNGLDDDCDGEADEGLGVGLPCDGDDADLCATGLIACAEGEAICTDDPESIAEICNEADDDCDGATDEGFDTGVACDGDDDDLCASGIRVCGGPDTVVCSDDPTSNVELCNGLDDDCDGEMDEGYGLGAGCDGADADLCAEGVIVCDTPLTTRCSDDSATNVEDICNTIDDDCDTVEGMPSAHAIVTGSKAVREPQLLWSATRGKYALFWLDCVWDGDDTCVSGDVFFSLLTPEGVAIAPTGLTDHLPMFSSVSASDNGTRFGVAWTHLVTEDNPANGSSIELGTIDDDGIFDQGPSEIVAAGATPSLVWWPKQTVCPPLDCRPATWALAWHGIGSAGTDVDVFFAGLNPMNFAPFAGPFELSTSAGHDFDISLAIDGPSLFAAWTEPDGADGPNLRMASLWHDQVLANAPISLTEEQHIPTMVQGGDLFYFEKDAVAPEELRALRAFRSGASFVVSNGPTVLSSAMANPTDKIAAALISSFEYGVAWQDNRDTNSVIYFARTGNEFMPLSAAEHPVTSSSASVSDVTLAYHDGEFAIVWIDRRDDANGDLYFSRFRCDP